MEVHVLLGIRLGFSLVLEEGAEAPEVWEDCTGVLVVPEDEIGTPQVVGHCGEACLLGAPEEGAVKLVSERDVWMLEGGNGTVC